MNHKLRLTLLGLMPLALGACSGEIEGGPMPMSSASTNATDAMTPAEMPGLGTVGTGNGSPASTTQPGTTPSSSPSSSTKPPNALPADGETDVNTEVPTEVTDALAEAKPLPMVLNGEPIFARTVRLTHEQWEHSVHDLLMLDGETGQRERLTADALGVHDFDNNELNLEVGSQLWADYQTAAEALAAQVAGTDANLSKIYSGTDAAGFITSFGLRAFRRPLSTTEQASYQSVYDTGAALSEGGSTPFARGAGLVIQAMLQSPHFLYRTELQDAGSRLNGYEIAAKLSLLLRGTTPSDQLLEAAANNELDSDEQVKTLATQMVDEADIAAVMRSYHSQMFSFARIDALDKDTQTVPEYSKDLNAELKESAYQFFDHMFADGLGVNEMLTSTKAYVSPAMAKIYGVTASGTGFQEVDLGASRQGYFSQLPFLIVNAVNLVPDSIHRGVALNREVLCAEVPPPIVAGVTLPGRKEGQSNREVVEAATGNGTCGEGCHSVYINTLGFAFENFDGMGKARDMDAGKDVDTTGTYPFSDDDGVPVAFDGAADLMAKMAERTQVHDCYAKHLAGFVLQRDLSEDDRPLLSTLSTASAGSSGSVKDLLLSLVSAPAFTTRTSGAVK